MNHKSTSERLAAAIERTRRRWEALQKGEAKAPQPVAPAPRAFTIALSREAGTDAPQIAQLIGERLGWPVYDRELLQHIAEEMGVRTRLLDSVDERRKNWVQECLEALGSGKVISEGGYVRHLVETLLSLAAHGECVIVGRGAAQILSPETTLRIRLVGSPAERAESIRQRLGISREEATRWVEKTDRERDRFVKDHFNKDPVNPAFYDLVINAPRFTPADCANFVLEALERRKSRVRAN